MIDKLGKIAQILQVLRIPVLIFGLGSLLVLVVVIFTSESHKEDFYLIPSIVGVLWAITTFSFLTVFSSIPHKAEQSWKFFRRVKRRLVRIWYGILAITFLGTTVLALSVTYRILSIWVRDYLSKH